MKETKLRFLVVFSDKMLSDGSKDSVKGQYLQNHIYYMVGSTMLEAETRTRYLEVE